MKFLLSNPLIFPAIGALIFTVFSILGVMREKGKDKWLKTDAIVKEHLKISRSSSTNASPYYKPKIQYEYTINGKEYLANKEIKGPKTGTTSYYKNEEATKLLNDSHPIGSTVEIYYNPDQAWDSEIYLDKNGAVTFWAGFFFLATIGFFIGFFLKLKT